MVDLVVGSDVVFAMRFVEPLGEFTSGRRPFGWEEGSTRRLVTPNGGLVFGKSPYCISGKSSLVKYYNLARLNGTNFWRNFPFNSALFGLVLSSLTWKMASQRTNLLGKWVIFHFHFLWEVEKSIFFEDRSSYC